MTEEKTMNYFMESLLNSQFPQFHLYKAKEFLDFLKNRGINLREEELEFYDKNGILKPILRLKRPLSNRSGQKYASMFFEGTKTFSELYRAGIIELPKENDFQPWKNYRDGYEEKTWQYYHPFQAIPFRRLTSSLTLRLLPSFFENDPKNLNEWFQISKKRVLEDIELSSKISKQYIPKIGLMMLLEEAYSPYVKGFYNPSFREKDSLEKWIDWRKNKFDPKIILKNSGLSIDEVKNWYNWLATEGLHNDPLNKWSPLLLLLRRSKKRKLENTALLVQDYYESAKIVSLFIKDLTGEKMFEPDEWGEGNEGWKARIYGDPFEPNSTTTQKAILDDFLIQRPMKIAIVYEGESEDEVIKMILKSYQIAEPEEEGLVLYCAKGSGNIEGQNLHGLISMAEKNGMDVYVIVDKDSESILTPLIENGTIKSGMFTVWENDFEYDNFGIDNVVQKVNEKLKEKGLEVIDPSKVRQRMTEKQFSLMRAINDISYLQNKKRVDEVISKKALSVELFSNIINTKKTEKIEFVEKTKIEVIIDKILNSIPRYMDV